MKKTTNQTQTNAVDSSKNAVFGYSREMLLKAKDLMDELFEELKGLFPAYKQSWPTEPEVNKAKLVWLKAFMQEGITELEQINRGLACCRKSGSRFVPSVGEFISWCKPSVEELGLPSLLTALREAIKNCREREHERVWTHEIVYWAYLRSNTWLLLHAANETVPPDFRAAYEELAAKIANGEALAPIPRVIAPKIEEKRDTETGRAALEALKALFNKKD